MTRSIRANLLFILLLTMSFAWVGTAAWIFTNSHQQVERVLDARLRESANMVSSLIEHRNVEVALSSVNMGATSLDIEADQPAYLRQLTCQIWSLSGGLVGESAGAPSERLASREDGFSERTIGGESWRVYAVTNPERGVQIMVGDSITVRRTLVWGVMKGTLLPMLAILPIAALLIWLGVRRGLSPLDRMAATLSGRRADELQPVDTHHVPRELGPITHSINSLLRRVDTARERERTFTAFAAHELKTPLAGLKTQAQIALASDDKAIRDHALHQISTSVDRSARMVRQLLDLTAADIAESSASASTSIGPVIRDLCHSLDHLAAKRGIELLCEGCERSLHIACDATLSATALRNVIENAVANSPAAGRVRILVVEIEDGVVVTVEDDGRGMSPELIDRVGERFLRNAETGILGSGLGLSIVQAVLSRCGGELSISNRNDVDGLSVALTFPASKRTL